MNNKLHMVKSFCLLAVLCLYGCAETQTKLIPSSLASFKRETKTPVPTELIGERIEVGLGELLATTNTKKHLGLSLESKDKEMAGSLARRALESLGDKQAADWENSETQHMGKFEVLNTVGVAEKNLVCRDFIHTLTVDKNAEKVYGKVCRQMWDPKSKWQLQG